MADLREFDTHGVTFDADARRSMAQVLETMQPGALMHLAVLRQPYLGLVMDGTKTVESRFSKRRVPPYGRVAVGDVVMIREPGKPVEGYFTAAEVVTFDLARTSLTYVKQEYSDFICPVDPGEFWRERKKSRYATLITVSDVTRCEPFEARKNDQRAWVTFDLPDVLF